MFNTSLKISIYSIAGHLALAVLSIALFARCDGDSKQVQFNLDKLESDRGSEGSSKKSRNNGDADDERSGSNNANRFESGSDDVVEDYTDEEDDIDYPILRFLGNGQLDHTNGTANVSQSLTALMNKTRVTMTVTKFGAVSGDNRGNVDDEIKDDTGNIEITRPSRAEVLTMGKSKLKSGSTFLIFGTNVVNSKNQKSDSFAVTGEFLPVLLIPASKSRYDELVGNPIRYTSSLNARYMKDGNLEQVSFTIQTMISLVTSNDSRSTIRLEFTIPEDVEGNLYEIFPLAKRTDFNIDHASKRIVGMSTLSHYKDDGRRDVSLNYSLCEFKSNGILDRLSLCDF